MDPEAAGVGDGLANPLIDDKAVLARTIVQTVLTAPTNTELLLKVLNFDAMLEQQGLPVSGAGVGVGVGEDREGQAGNGGRQQTTDGGEEGRGSADGQVQELARGLLRRRELSRWRSGRRGRRTFINTRDKAAVDLAGFKADEPRDEQGRWTAGSDVGASPSADQANKTRGITQANVPGAAIRGTAGAVAKLLGAVIPGWWFLAPPKRSPQMDLMGNKIRGQSQLPEHLVNEPPTS